MGYWKRHQKKELEDLLEDFHALNWRVEDPPRYYTVKCPCGLHKRSVHLTPSDPRYAQNARRWLLRQECTTNGDTTNDTANGEEAPQ